MLLLRKASLSALALLLNPLNPLTVAVYDRANRHVVENFDPAEADPRVHITCSGPLPPWRLPDLPSNVDPNTFTLQQLCAKPQYGGRAPDQHVSTWCAFPPLPGEHTPASMTLATDLSDGARSAPELMNPRLWLYCHMRCFCNPPGGSLSEIEYDGEPDSDNMVWQRASDTYMIKADIYDDFNIPMQLHMGEGEGDVVSARIRTDTEIEFHHPEVYEDSQYRYISMDPENYIQCEDHAPWREPRAPLPWPYEPEDFDGMMELCAAALASDNVNGHGRVDVNAGGYCHRLRDGHYMLWFADEFTPRLDWSWAYASSIPIRDYCRRFCHCKQRRLPAAAEVNATQTDSESGESAVLDDAAAHWHILDTVDVVSRPDGSMVLEGRSPYEQDSSKNLMIAILSPTQSGVPQALGTCGPKRNQTCRTPWPSSLLGPQPTFPPGAGTSLSSAAPSSPAVASPPPPPPPNPLAVNKLSPFKVPTAPSGPPPPNTNNPSTSQTSAEVCALQNNNKPCDCSGSCSTVSQGCSLGYLGLCKCTARPITNFNGHFFGACAPILSHGHGRRLGQGVKGGPANGSISDNTTDGSGGSILTGVFNATGSGTAVTQGLLNATTLRLVPCPCNVTYVSFACCDSADGIVHEPPEMKLGVLVA